MKRTLLAILMLSIFITGVAYSESATITGTIDAFSLRNGITFGMTKDQVKAAEELDAVEDRYVQYNNLKIVGSIAGINNSSCHFIFDDDSKLESVEYCFNGSLLSPKSRELVSSEYDAIEKSLNDKYGSQMSERCSITSSYYSDYATHMMNLGKNSYSGLMELSERLVKVQNGGYVKIEHWSAFSGMIDNNIEFTDHFILYSYFSDGAVNSVINNLNDKEAQKDDDL